MIYLALITQRVPILPPFAPTHVGGDAPRVPFGEVFDVPWLAAAIHSPILEWKDVKSGNSTEADPLGCWTVWETIHEEGGVRKPMHSWLADELHVGMWLGNARSIKLLTLTRHASDMSYTPVPDWVSTANRDYTTFARLARLGYPETRAQSLGDPHPSKSLGLKVPPDDHLLCFDILYFVSSDLVRPSSSIFRGLLTNGVDICSLRLARGV